MKKLMFLAFFSLISFSVFGQQVLWSTIEGKDTKYIPIRNVIREVVKFYEQYKYYIDCSGYSKDRFIENFDYGFEDWKWLYDINDLTVFALRSNMGRGSVVLVMCISRNNVNTIIFTNVLEQDCISEYGIYPEKFARWFETLLN
jgi:hypothetical protein